MAARRAAERKAKALARDRLYYIVNDAALSQKEVEQIVGKQAHVKTPLYRPMTCNPRKRNKGAVRETMAERNSRRSQKEELLDIDQGENGSNV